MLDIYCKTDVDNIRNTALSALGGAKDPHLIMKTVALASGGLCSHSKVSKRHTAG